VQIVTEFVTDAGVEPKEATTAPTTIERLIGAGPAVRSGRVRPFRRLASFAGEPRRRRSPNGLPSALGAGAQSLLRLVHFTDFQLADVQSPGRFEYFQLLVGRPEAGTFVPAQRPQEALAVHAAEVLLRTIARLDDSSETGARLGLALCTGDSIDNAQANELSMFLALMSGGEVRAGSGGARYDGVQARGWPNHLYWHPDPGTTDDYKTDLGFPEHPGLLDEAMVPFAAHGLGLPWLSCFGNHEALILGTAVPSEEYRRAVVGSRKAVGPPSTLTSDLEAARADFLDHPEHFLAGPAREVEADADRRIIGRAEFVAAHLAASGRPQGHGFSGENLAASTAYAVHDDVDAIRVILLDTTNLDGYYEGSIGRRQFAWLEERLVEVHARFRTPDGDLVQTGNADRIVVLASHHGLATLTNDRQLPAGLEDDQPRALAAEIRALLHRFGNVVLWLNGHRHVNEIVHWPSPYDDEGGIWEVSTASLADWPCQARVVELVAGQNGALSILSTMVDHDAAIDPEAAHGIERLASLHRELAANVYGSGYDSSLAGSPDDRNVELISKLPFAR
jgi:metallophosphoesterase (TIGR03767 family)